MSDSTTLPLRASDTRGTEPPSPLDAAERAVDATQRLAVDRLALARVELEEALARRVRPVVGIAIGTLVALPGSIALVLAGAATLTPHLGEAGALAVLGLLHLGAGVGIAVAMYCGTRAEEA